MTDQHEAMKRRIYRNPPIVEAVVEVRYKGSRPWTLTTPGRFFDLLRDPYPEEPTQREVLEASLGSGESSADPVLSLNRHGQRVMFKNGNKLLMIGQDVMSVHSLDPYEGWDHFRPRILNALGIYSSVATPSSVFHIGVRYINKIVIPQAELRLDEYFTVTQGLPPSGFPEELRSFFDRMELAYPDIPAVIAFTWSSSKTKKAESSAFMLDLDLKWTESCDPDNAIDRIDTLRERERVAFESLLGDKLRGMFDDSPADDDKRSGG